MSKEKLQSRESAPEPLPEKVQEQAEAAVETAEKKADLAAPIVEQSENELKKSGVTKEQIVAMKQEAESSSIEDFATARQKEAEEKNIDATLYASSCIGACYTLDMVMS